MKIAIEAQRIFRPNKHGMDFVALETIRELQKMDHENEYFIFVSPGEDKCLVPGEILKIHRHALWEIPDGVDYEDAAVLDPICNASIILPEIVKPAVFIAFNGNRL